TLSYEDIYEKVRRMVDLGGIEILMQGGVNPALKLEWYEGLLRGIKERFGKYGVILHAFSPVELIYTANISNLSLRDTLIRLKEAGLDSIPGGGAEVLTDRVRGYIAPYKDTSQEWLDCMRSAHKVGIRSSVTMMYGSVDSWEDRLEHLIKAWGLQDDTS